MEESRRLFRAVVTDRRIWGVWLLLAGWPALGALTEIDFVRETATPVVYVYLLALNAVVPGFPGGLAFWAGFVLFCFGVGTVLVGLFDWLRTRSVLDDLRDRWATE